LSSFHFLVEIACTFERDDDPLRVPKDTLLINVGRDG
jgi:hypothetical protein